MTPGTMPTFLACLIALFFSGYTIAHALQYIAYFVREAKGDKR